MMMDDLFGGDQPAEEPAAEEPKKKGRAKKPKAQPAQAEAIQAEPLEGEATEASIAARTELVVSEAAADPVALFTDEKRYSQFYEKIAAEVSKLEPDTSTDKGRQEIRATAFRVTKAKTALDKAGLALTEEWRAKTKLVNESRKKMCGELDELADKVRAPLTEWEEAEEERLERVQAELDRFRAAAAIQEGETSQAVQDRGRALFQESLSVELFRDRLEEAQAAKDAAVAALAQAYHRLKKEEEDAAELEQLRREKAEREERERIEREAREAAEAEQRRKEEAERIERERKEAEERRIQEERERAAAEARQAELDRIAEERRAEEEARQAEEVRREEARQAELRAAEEARAAERVAEASRLEEERRQREAAEAEAQRLRDEEAARIEREKAEAEAQRKREADKAHRRKIAGEAKEDILELIPEDIEEPARSKLAAAVVLAVAAGAIRHITIQF